MQLKVLNFFKARLSIQQQWTFLSMHSVFSHNMKMYMKVDFTELKKIIDTKNFRKYRIDHQLKGRIKITPKDKK